MMNFAAIFGQKHLQRQNDNPLDGPGGRRLPIDGPGGKRKSLLTTGDIPKPASKPAPKSTPKPSTDLPLDGPGSFQRRGYPAWRGMQLPLDGSGPVRSPRRGALNESQQNFALMDWFKSLTKVRG